ncbi:hypothetical protein Nepgr_010235 [Nepenthes gracilis]|uniref:Uncharacterized protein n=1 Tax=Nepenthes gracilis TaxID=150966 RepID=A0AAD3SCM8_NEPGR|nr:hypothetical protein Nepgr_010235 [Nepenthes gracilis]
MPCVDIFAMLRCLRGCQDRANGATTGLSTRILNLSDRPIELQLRVGSVLMKVHTLKPGSSKRLRSKSIYKAYMPVGNGGVKRFMYHYDEGSQPYVWIHETGGGFSRMVKQQYISLEDLRDYSEIWIFRDHRRGCISVRKNLRSKMC